MPQAIVGILISVAISVALTVAKMLLFPPPQPQRRQQQQQAVPKSADGKFNLKQNVPPLAFVYGRVKKGGDYVFLEETGGSAFHITVWAGHRIEGFVQHYLHDEAVTTDINNWVVAPAHFDSKVRITTSVGPDVATAWGSIVGFFPTIWTNDHRGDGLAQTVMEAITVSEERYLEVFPQQMPVLTSVGDGALLYDPREVGHDPDDPSTWAFAKNLALIRLDYLTKPFGGKLTLADMNLTSWANAANVCDGAVTTGTSLAINGAFATDTDWTKGAGWTIAAGLATKAAGAATMIEQALAGMTAGMTYEISYTLSGVSAGTVLVRLKGSGASADGAVRAANGSYIDRIAAVAGNNAWGFLADASFVGSIDNVSVRGEEPRYHGGLWGYFDNDSVDIGRTLDEAGELVVFEGADGKIAVHAGEMVTPDIRITADDIKELQYDANRRAASTVLAVRGRWTSPAAIYNTVDAAIYGAPYVGTDDTQRTKTVDNQAVQSHNHVQRLQKIAFTRANAARVKITIDYDAESPSRLVAYRRFVRVHYPTRGLDEAIVEITGRPKLSLAKLTITFEGIVVPATLYSFNAATEEGTPGGAADSIVAGGVPAPDNFAVAIGAETLAGGQTAAFALASWDFLSDALTYELEFQVSDESEVPQAVMSKPGDVEVRTPALGDGIEYQFRLRAWSNGAFSDWTVYETETATADAMAPGQATDFATSVAGSDVTATWTNPNSPNLYKTELYRGTTSTFGAAAVIYTAYGGIGEARSYEDAGLAANTYYYWVRSENASGVASTEVGPETETI